MRVGGRTAPPTRRGASGSWVGVSSGGVGCWAQADCIHAAVIRAAAKMALEAKMRLAISATSLRQSEEDCSLIWDGRRGNGGWDDVVARHDTADIGEVRRVFGTVGGGELAEVLGTEEAWGEQADDAGGGLLVVEAGVDGAAWDVELLARVKGDAALIDDPGSDAVHGEDGFVGDAVQVRDVELGVRRDDELEEVGGALGLVATLEKGDAEFADLDGLVHRTLSRLDEEDDFGDHLVGHGVGEKVTVI